MERGRPVVTYYLQYVAACHGVSFGAMLCSTKSDAGHIKYSSRPQVTHPCCSC